MQEARPGAGRSAGSRQASKAFLARGKPAQPRHQTMELHRQSSFQDCIPDALATAAVAAYKGPPLPGHAPSRWICFFTSESGRAGQLASSVKSGGSYNAGIPSLDLRDEVPLPRTLPSG